MYGGGSWREARNPIGSPWPSDVVNTIVFQIVVGSSQIVGTHRVVWVQE